jgi:hypothetical protein
MTTSTLPFTALAPGVAIGSPAPAAWRRTTDLTLVVIVGVTGVGKSTTLGKLAQAAVPYTLLPNRRDLTDRLIISYIQALDGVPIQPVTDRKVRFEYTRRYRSLFAGGMSHALTQLWLDPTQLPGVILFDGLRGAEEVGHAVQALPQAHFVVLAAPDAVRVQRLLTRQDSFDQVAGAAMTADAQTITFATLGLPEASALFTPAEAQAILALVQRGEVTADDLRAKLQIVVEERRNYDPAAAIALLQAQAPQRSLIVDTASHTPDQVVGQIVARLRDWRFV